jgi:murein L,D-transpeptidase YafK
MVSAGPMSGRIANFDHGRAQGRCFMRIVVAVVVVATLAVFGGARGGGTKDIPPRAPLAQRLSAQGFVEGQAVYLRIFKADNVLELWLKDGDRYRLFETYPICRWSGALGPKLREGDQQAPEGFYSVTRAQMNPTSRYHRAFNLGFPNVYDRANGRTGSFLMVHGACASVGCYAMTDAQIDEIFNLMSAAFTRGQKEIAVDILPFRPTKAAMTAHASNPWAPFWRTLAQGSASFDVTGRPAAIFVCGKSYRFDDGPECSMLRGPG